MRIVRAGRRAFVLPLRRPLETAHGATDSRAGFLVTLEDEAGRFGHGEATPLPTFGGEDLAACEAALRRALEILVDAGEADVDALFVRIAAATGGAPCARSALEGVLAELAAQAEGRSRAQWIRRRAGLAGEPARAVRAQALVGGRDPDAVRASAEEARAQGFTTFKLKLAVSSGARGADLARVAALRSVVGPEARIRLDANEAWTREEAERALARLAPFDVEFVEQPVARDDLEGLADLDRRGAIAVAADEALEGEGLEACLAKRAASIFVVKPALLGGIDATIDLALRARAKGIRLVFSNLIEGRVGRALATALAAALGEPGADGREAVHGLGTAALLARDVDEGPCWALEGEIYGEGLVLAARPVVAARSTGWLARLGAVSPAQTAFVFEGRAWSYAELGRAAEETGASLAALGLRAGDLVAVLASPSAAGIALIHALLERGIVLLPLNTRLAESELAQALASTRPTALLVSDASELAQAERLAEETAVPLFRFADGAGLAPSFERRPVADGAPAVGPDDVDPDATSRARDDVALRRVESLAQAHAALVLLTSGTSGRPKAAILRRENLIASAEASARLLGSDAADRWLLCLPLFHIAGLSILVRAALAGACVFVEPRFEAARVAESLERDRISHVSLVATTLAQLLDALAGKRAPSSLRLALIGGGPAAPALLERARVAGIPVAPTYGLTEAASQVATQPPSASADGLVPLPGVGVRIVDDAGRPVEAGVEGEIEVRGPIVMAGYLDDDAATRRALRDGWLATGDVGRLDAAGRLRVLDRRTDLILSGGENVYPAEVESILCGHPDVVEAGVVGVDDARFGARPLAFVVWRDGAGGDAAALAAWCRERLAGYKVPVDFVATTALPRNASGKLLRRVLAERIVPR